MKHIRYIQMGWLMLLVALLLAVMITPAGATSSTTRHTAQGLDNTTSVDATIYITLGTLTPRFQDSINQQVPVAVNSAITSIVSKLPKQDQGWAQQMANTLIQPSATLTGLTTQQNGIVTSISISLYPGDPRPLNTSMLVSFRVIDSSTIQVTATPINGSPALASGPLATFQIPVGQLSSISTTPACGDAALGVKLQFPVALGHGQTAAQIQPSILNSFVSRDTPQRLNSVSGGHTTYSVAPSADTDSYIELPASSLASIGNSVGDLPINNSMTAKNIRIGVEGSNLVITSDVYDSFWGKIGTAVTTVAPTASSGNLAVHVLSTSIQVFGLFTIPYDRYNNQIEQTLNSKLNGALAGKFYVTQAAIGPNAHVPCAAGDSLVMTGQATLG
jgi:hypothetical protein